VPESKKRKRPERSPRSTSGAAGTAPVKKKGPSPRWLAPLMLTLFGIGVLWLVVFYITQARMGGLPGVSDIGNWNLLVGFGFIIAGFGLSTQWR
jgi:hypothetical protein